MHLFTGGNLFGQIGEVKFYVNDGISGKTLNEALQEEFQIKQNEGPLNLGYVKGEVWITVEIDRFQDKKFLHITNPKFKEVDFYFIEDGIMSRGFETGLLRPTDSRDVAGPFFIFEIPPGSNDQVIAIRLTSDDGFVTNFKLYSENQLQRFLSTDLTVPHFTLGIIISLTILYLIIFISLREKDYLYYTLYSFLIIFSVLKVNGLWTYYLWPNQPALNNYSALIETGVSFAAGLFSIHFLKLKTYTPKINILIWVTVGNTVVASLISILGFNSLATQVLETGAMIFILAIIPTSAYIFFKYDYRPAKYFLISFSFLSLGSMIYIMSNYGWLTAENLIVNNALELGVGAEMVFLAIGVSKRIDLLRINLIKTQKENLQIVSEQNEVLEEKVNEKTEELLNQNEHLKVTISELKNAQSKLIESEKLATVGYLSSGIAHELNNPVNFISGCAHSLVKNLSELREIQKLTDSFLKQYKDSRVNGELSKVAGEIENKKNEVDYHILIDETSELLKNVQSGANRASRILDHLKYFTRDSQKNFSKILLEDNIQAIISILRSEIPDSEMIEYDFDPDLTVHCIPAKFNQAVMNIILNSLQSIEEKGKILITANSNGERVDIDIADNGEGIDPEIGNKVFEPFFTTREDHVGLGLTLASAAISEHEGNLEIVPSEKEGTVIRISLPA